MASDPTREIGNAGSGLLPWNSFADSSEEVAELAWPQSVRSYNKIRNDEQVSGLLDAYTLPIRGYRWYVDPNGADDEVAERTARNLGIPIEGQDAPSGRLKGRGLPPVRLTPCL